MRNLSPGSPKAEPNEETLLVEALRRHDEAAYLKLVTLYHPKLLQLARTIVRDPELAQDVVQEAWLGVLRGIDRFEARSSLRTWISRIVVNRARTRVRHEKRTVPFSVLAESGLRQNEPSIDPEHFQDQGGPLPGHWTTPPTPWGADPERRLASLEARHRIDTALLELPEGQRVVMTLRDVNGYRSEEVCNILGITETNQRVLLHRARAHMRRQLDPFFRESRGAHARI